MLSALLRVCILLLVRHSKAHNGLRRMLLWHNADGVLRGDSSNEHHRRTSTILLRSVRRLRAAVGDVHHPLGRYRCKTTSAPRTGFSRSISEATGASPQQVSYCCRYHWQQ